MRAEGGRRAEEEGRGRRARRAAEAGSAAHLALAHRRLLGARRRLALRLLLRRRRVALEGRRAHRAAQRGELADVLVPRAPQHPDLRLQLRVGVGERAHVLARLGRTALDLGDSHRALLRGGAQRRRQLLELFDAKGE